MFVTFLKYYEMWIKISDRRIESAITFLKIYYADILMVTLKIFKSLLKIIITH